MAKQTDRQIDRTSGGYLQSPFIAGNIFFQPLSVEKHPRAGKNAQQRRTKLQKCKFTSKEEPFPQEFRNEFVFDAFKHLLQFNNFWSFFACPFECN